MKTANTSPVYKTFSIIKNFLKDHWAAWFLCALVYVFWVYLLTAKYLNFGYDDWDLAFFNQATWNLLHGNTFVSLFGMHFFGNHADLIAYIILPLYALSTHPLTLIYLKILCVVGGGLLFYKIIVNDLGKPQSLFLLLLYFVYPPNIFGILYEFDYESLCPIFLFALYILWKQRRYTGFLVLALLTMSIKENIPLIILAFGLLTFFQGKRKDILWGGVITVTALSAFYYLTSIFIPLFREGQPHAYLVYYKELGSSPIQILINAMIHPDKILTMILQPANTSFIFNLFAPVLFLCFGNPATLFLASPILFQHLLSQGETNHSIYFQYGISMAPFIFLALSQTLHFLKKHTRIFTSWAILAVILLLTLLNLEAHAPMLTQRAGLASNPLKKFQWKMLEQIPSHGVPIATFSFLAELSSRKELYAFHKVYSYDFQRGENPFIVPPQVNYSLIDFNNPWLAFEYHHSPVATSARLRKFYEEGKWGAVESAQETVLFKKEYAGHLIQRMPFTAWPEKTKSTQGIDSKFTLISFKGPTDTTQTDTLWPMEFAWHSLGQTKNQYAMVFRIQKDGIPVYSYRREIGYKIYPTFTWDTDEVIVEKYNLFIPRLEPGHYTLNILFINTSRNPRQLVQAATGETGAALSLKLIEFRIL